MKDMNLHIEYNGFIRNHPQIFNSIAVLKWILALYYCSEQFVIYEKSPTFRHKYVI